MPESPRWLVARGRRDEAAAVLARCYPAGADVDAVVREIAAAVADERRGGLGWRDLLVSPAPPLRRALVAGVGTAVAQQLTAIEAVQYYALYILEAAGVDSVTRRFEFLLLIGAVKVAVIVVAGRLFDDPRFGRRPLLIASNLGIAASLAVLGGAVAAASAPLALAALLGYVTFFSLGMGPGCWLVCAEVFPLRARARAMSLATCANRGLSAVGAATFLTARRSLGDAGFCCLFAVLAVCNAAFVFLCVPETKGRTLEAMAAAFGAGTDAPRVVELPPARAGDLV